MQYEQKHYLLAKYYIDKYNDTQTPESLWLHIQILQALLDNGTDVVRDREYTSYRNTIAKVLVDNYGNSSEAQQCILKYGQPSALSYGFSNKNYAKPAPLVVTNTAVPNTASESNNVVLNATPKPVIDVNNSTDSEIKQDASGRRYLVVLQGMTAYSISRKYNLTVRQLENYNKMHSAQIITGMKLYIDPR